MFFSFFFFNDPATTELYTLSLHDALPISVAPVVVVPLARIPLAAIDHLAALPLILDTAVAPLMGLDRKSTRLNSSHPSISYAVFCLKKKNQIISSTRCTRSPLLLSIRLCF